MEEYMYIAAIVGCVFGILQIILLKYVMSLPVSEKNDN